MKDWKAAVRNWETRWNDENKAQDKAPIGESDSARDAWMGKYIKGAKT